MEDNPYYDDFTDYVWLLADIVFSTPLVITYFVCRVLNLDHVQNERIQNHFNTYKLNKLYSSHAQTEIHEIKHILKKIKQEAGNNAVSQYLNEQFESRFHNNKNS